MAMTIQAGEYKSRVGLRDIYYAIVSEDSLAAFTVGTPKYLAPAASATQAPATNTETQYADDQPFDVVTSKGEIEVVVNVTAIPLVTLAEITGEAYDAANGRMYDVGGTAPYVALGFRTKKSNGKYLYYWYMKGTFNSPNEDSETLGETPTPQTQEITYTAIQTVHKFDVGQAEDKALYRVKGDEDATGFDATGWFTEVQTPDVLEVSS